ncbi:RNA exonuclease 1 [Halotydeus destructor]|nr:RNA exonuclease 1 [Halotydeus destructor]
MSIPFKPTKRNIEVSLDQVSAKNEDGPAKVMKLTFDSEARMQLYELRTKAEKLKMISTPLIKLTNTGMASRHVNNDKSREVKPISLSEMQTFVLSCFLPQTLRSYHPTCAEVQRCHSAPKICVFILDGDATFEPDPKEMELFQEVIRFETNPSWVDTLLNVPLSKQQITKTFVDSGIETDYVEGDMARKNHMMTPATKTKLLLSPLQMAVEDFPLPGDDQYVPTKDCYREVTDKSPFFALDCEMCVTVGGKSEITQISVVDEDEKVVYDQYVKPANKIINFQTRLSGITKEIMAGPTTTLPKALRELKQILPPDAILCGHSLRGDLKQMGVMHPYVVDTSVIYNLSGVRSTKSSLKALSDRFLNQKIQQGSGGHSAVEDAIATLRLVKLKVRKGLEFGDNVASPVNYARKSGQDDPLPLTKYLKVKNMDVKLFYDYVDFDCNKFFAVFGSRKKMNEVVKKCISSMEKVVCIVMTSQGLCYIRS